MRRLRYTPGVRTGATTETAPDYFVDRLRYLASNPNSCSDATRYRPTARSAPAALVDVPASGMSWAPNEVDAWRARAASGPFKTANDAFTGAPGDWTRILANADACVASGNESLATNIYTDATAGVDRGYRCRDAAFVWLVNPATATYTRAQYFTAAETALLALCNAASNQIELACIVNDSPLGAPQMFSRMALAYDYLRGGMSAPNRQTVENRLRLAGDFFHQWLNLTLWRNTFPGSPLGDYTYLAGNAGQVGDAAFFNDGSGRGQYAYVDSTPVRRNRVTNIGASYNNRKAEMVYALALIACVLLEPVFADAAVRDNKEFLMFGVNGDGSLHEWGDRAFDYQYPQQGRIYGSTQVACYAGTAEFMRRAFGDLTLYQFTTTAQLVDSKIGVGPHKSLKLVIETELDLRARLKDWWAVNPAVTNDASQIRTDTHHMGRQETVVGDFGSQSDGKDITYITAAIGYESLGDYEFATKVRRILLRDRSYYSNLEAFPGTSGTPIISAALQGVWDVSPGVCFQWVNP